MIINQALRLVTAPMTKNTANTAISAATIVEPTGVPARIEVNSPSSAQKTETIAEQTVTLLKLLNSRIADSAGKMTSAEIRSDPTRFMARTMMTAIMIAISRLYTFAFVPVAVEKSSSKVTAKILLYFNTEKFDEIYK